MYKNDSYWIKLVYSMTCVIGLLICTSCIFAGELVETGRIPIPGRGWVNMHVEGDYVYLVKYGNPETFCVVNVSDKSAPWIEGQIDDLPFSNAHDLWYSNGYAYTAHRHGGVNMIDVSDPASPFVQSTAPSTYTHAGIMSVGDYFYLADHSAYSYPGGIRIYDISDNNLNLVGTLLGDIDGRDFAIASDGLYAYQSSGIDQWDTAKLYSYDISDKTNPCVLNFIPDIYGLELGISPDDRLLYMTYQEPNDFAPPPKGVKIYDLSNRAQPVEISTYSLNNVAQFTIDHARNIFYTKVFVNPGFPGNPGIHVLDISDPHNPTELYYLEGNKFGDLFYSENYLYVDEYQLWEPQSELVIFTCYETVVKASVDFWPRFLNKKIKFGFIAGFIELPENYDVRQIDKGSVKISAIAGEKLSTPIPARNRPWCFVDFNRNGKKELMVFFSRRKVINAIGERTGCLELTLNGAIEGTAFSGSNSINVYNWPHPATLAKGNIFPEELDNLEVPLNFALGQNYPNPFNPDTHIDYQLPENSHVKIQIFNTLGQEIKMLVNNDKTAGYYTVHWNGRDKHGNRVVSGIYLYRIKAGDYSCTGKMAIMK